MYSPVPPKPVHTASSEPGLTARLDAERLDVYSVALAFQLVASEVPLGRGHSVLRDQLERATSIVLNLAEGAGRRSPHDKARFYAIAHGSAAECAAILDLLRLRRLAAESVCRHGREKLVRIVPMLTKLETATLRRTGAA